MNHRSLSSLLLVGAFGVAGLAGCGGSGGSNDSASTTPADADLVVTALEGVKWDKSEYTAAAGDVTVALHNDSSLPHILHMVRADGTQLAASLDASSKGSSDTKDFTLEAGSYTVICSVPGHGNMKSTLTVS